jgi:ribosomal protection tetracycline resistance protein
VHLLNLGIVAHVDAGKTSLTERRLFAAGVVEELGSVDAGRTRTDSLALERRRGITIKAAVVPFEIGDVTVSLIDTSGHPDFIAEVERVLGVLDAAVLVISAVEGVQAQTRVLLRALRRLAFTARLTDLLTRHDDAQLAEYVVRGAAHRPPAAQWAGRAEPAGAGAPGVLRVCRHGGGDRGAGDRFR